MNYLTTDRILKCRPLLVFACTCLDNVLRGIACKHIHLVHSIVTEQQKSDTISSVQISHQTQTETDQDNREFSKPAAGESGHISSKEPGSDMQTETSLLGSAHINDEYSHSFNDCVAILLKIIFNYIHVNV